MKIRSIVFQIHLWTGLGVGLYVFLICLSGSILVYRNELYRAFSPQPRLVQGSGPLLPEDQLAAAARRAYAGFALSELRRGPTDQHAVEITLRRGDAVVRRLFDPFTGADLGNPLPLGFRATAWLLDFHDNLLGGERGRRVNGAGALLLLVLCASGAVVWWPAAGRWRRSITIDLRASPPRLIWSVHSALGFWFFGFIALWGITGAYLALPDRFAAAFDYLQPLDEANPVERTVDTIQYWLAYLHFGRLGGRGIPGCGRGLCDSVTKAIWAGAGIVPPVMFATGVLMWWHRAARRRRRSAGSAVDADRPVGVAAVVDAHVDG